MLLEGITRIRIPLLVTRLLNVSRSSDKAIASSAGSDTYPGIEFSAERMMSLLVGLMLLVSYFWLNDVLWFLPWFLVIALIGSGASGFCPMLIALRRLGFK